MRSRWTMRNKCGFSVNFELTLQSAFTRGFTVCTWRLDSFYNTKVEFLRGEISHLRFISHRLATPKQTDFNRFDENKAIADQPPRLFTNCGIS